MLQRFIRAASLIPLAACVGTVNAQTDPGPSTRGLVPRIVPTSTAKQVVRYVYNGPVAYVRIENSEPGARRNEQPYSIEPGQIRAALQAMRLPSEKNEPLFNDEELDEIAAPISRALAQATDTQDVCFAVSGRHGLFAVIAPRRVTTARVFRTEGHLNLVFGLVRHDWDSEFKATGTVIPFEPGRRSAPFPDEPQVAIDPAFGVARRGGWIVLGGDAASAPAPAPSPATATPGAAPAPAAPASAPPASAPVARPSYESVAERLRTLQKLRDDGLITQQEYEQKRQEILKDL